MPTIAERIAAAAEALLGRADAVVTNTEALVRLEALLMEAKEHYEASLVAQEEVRRAMARYFGLLLGPDAVAVMAGKRRTTKKTELVQMVVTGGWSWRNWEGDNWDWCLPVVVILLDDDWKTPITDVPDEWQKGSTQYRLRAELVPPIWRDKLGLTEHQLEWVPLQFFLKGCDYLAFEKLVLLAPVTPITHGLWTHKDANVCEDMVLVGPIKEEHRLYMYLVLSLMGIRAFERFPNLLADVQHDLGWGEEVFVDGKGNTVAWTFLWWLVDQIIKVGASAYDAEVTTPADVPAGTHPDGVTVLANDWFLWLKGRIIARLWAYADEIYVHQRFGPAWERRCLSHKDITDALIKDGLWRYLSPAERDAQEAVWRHRADECELLGLRRRQRIGGLDLAGVRKAFGTRLLFQWLPETERVARENDLLDKFHCEVQVSRAQRLADKERLAWSLAEAVRLIGGGYGEWDSPDRADKEADRWLDLAWRMSRSKFLKEVANMLAAGYAGPELSGKLAETALKAYFSGDISGRELAIFADRSPIGQFISKLLGEGGSYEIGVAKVWQDKLLVEHDSEVAYITGEHYHG